MVRGCEQAICTRRNTGHSKHMERVITSSQKMHIKESRCTLGSHFKEWEYWGDEEWDKGHWSTVRGLWVDAHFLEGRFNHMHQYFQMCILFNPAVYLYKYPKELIKKCLNCMCKKAAELTGYEWHIRGQRVGFKLCDLGKVS